MARWFQYQAKTEPLPVPVVVVASFLSVVQFTGLFQYQVKAEPVLVPPPPAADVISPTTITSEVFFPRSIIYQAKTEPVLVPAAAATAVGPTTVTSEVFFPRSVIYQSIARSPYNPEIITVDKWFEPLSEPTKRKPFINQQDNNPPLYEATNPANTVYVPLSGNVSVKFKRQWQYQIKTDPIAVPAAEVVTEDKWHQAWSQPVRVKPKVVFQQALAWSGLTPAVAVTTAVEPTTSTSPVIFKRSIPYQSIAWTPQTIAAPTFVHFNMVQGDTGLTFRKSIIYQVNTQPVQEGSTASFWFEPLAEPVRQKRGLATRYQQTLAWSGFTPAVAPVVTAIEPTTATSPVIFRRSIQYQSLAWCPRTIVAPFVPTYFQFVQGDTGLVFRKTIIYQESAQAESPSGVHWYAPLSEPVRKKRGLETRLQQVLAWSTFTPAVAPVVTAVEPTTVTSQVVRPRSIIYQSLAWCPQTIAAPTFRYFNMVEGDTGLFFQKTIIYQESAQAESPERNIFWYQPLSEPVRQKRGLRSYLQQEPAWSTLTPAVTPVVTAVEPTTITSQVVRPRSIIYQSLAWCPQTITPPVFRYFNMVEGDTGLTFRKSIIYQVNTQPIQTEVPVLDPFWFEPLSEPVRQKRGLATNKHQALAWSGYTPPFVPPVTAVEPTTVTSQVVFKRSIAYQSLAWTPKVIIPETITEDKWHQPWSLPVRTRKFPTAEQQTLAWSGHTPATITVVYFPYVQGDTGLFFQKTIIYQESAQAESPETHIFWYQPWSEPVRQKRGLKTHLQQEPAWNTDTPVTPPVVVPAVEPTTLTSQVIFRRSLIYQSVTWIAPVAAETITEDKWHQTWSQPVRIRTLATAQQQALVWSGYTPQPETITEDKWHQAWSIPVKLKKTFLTDLQQAFIAPPIDPILLKTIPWYAPLSEPVRQKKGLGARLQQFFTTDANRPPEPPVFVILGATETNNDVASIFAVVYNPPVRCYVSIKEVPGSDPTYASIEETD